MQCWHIRQKSNQQPIVFNFILWNFPFDRSTASSSSLFCACLLKRARCAHQPPIHRHIRFHDRDIFKTQTRTAKHFQLLCFHFVFHLFGFISTRFLHETKTHRINARTRITSELNNNVALFIRRRVSSSAFLFYFLVEKMQILIHAKNKNCFRSFECILYCGAVCGFDFVQWIDDNNKKCFVGMWTEVGKSIFNLFMFGSRS